jgi:predicted enzyme related to lactoylglutathione lyase
VASEQHRWDDVTAAADRAVAPGGTVIRESADPTDRFITLTDPEGNEFCLVL